MIDLSVICQARMEFIPYRWVKLENLISVNERLNLASNFPEERWFHEFVTQDSRVLAGPILSEKIGILEAPPFHPVWQTLIASLCSREYRTALEELTGLNLKNHHLQFAFTRMNSGHKGSSHVDNPATVKLVQLLYFNEEWEHSWGGCLRILKNENPESVFQDVLPLLGSSVILMPDEKSWHTVTTVKPEALRARLALKMTFFPDSFDMTQSYEMYKQMGRCVYKLS
ncbi:2OG-Fe(II) oxygenase family protein [Nostoc sp. LPT]|uniref:2OG-Fe(II) oxygenase family protein n=1 Tax=Nostoc sp. LPT TaxID=2815387 RepID=UPI001DCE479B|nr:2OG-Fe(II) oxygenase family protein [Nostoc sp. LPT]MBN4002990.1 2OG-Fe(II) oxygenase [Nostoc sp. LPT]